MVDFTVQSKYRIEKNISDWQKSIILHCGNLLHIFLIPLYSCCCYFQCYSLYLFMMINFNEYILIEYDSQWNSAETFVWQSSQWKLSMIFHLKSFIIEWKHFNCQAFIFFEYTNILFEDKWVCLMKVVYFLLA